MTVMERHHYNEDMTRLFLIFLLLCATGRLSAQFQLEPQNATVLQGSDAHFNATLQGKWHTMTWKVNELFALSISAETGATTSSDRFSADNCSSSATSCWQFTIHDVSRNDSGPVTYAVLGENGEMHAQLFVQESGTVDILGGNKSVVQDHEVEFHCMTTGWFPVPTVIWEKNGLAVSASLYNTTTQPHEDSFNSTSVLKFTAAKNTTVECLATVPALSSPLSSSVYLVVVPKPTDWTVLIAVVVSIGSFALLVLLIIGIIFCYKRRKEKESNYQDEMRRTGTQSQISTVSTSAQRLGQVNQGYVTDGRTSLSPSELNDSGFGGANGSNRSEIPSVMNGNQTTESYSRAHNTLDGPSYRKHRHQTIV